MAVTETRPPVREMTPLPQLNDSEFRRVQRIVYETAGIAITDTSRTLLSSRVRRRLKVLRLNSFADYLKRLRADSSGRELDALMDVVSTNETSFFRTPAHFDWFARSFLPERMAQASRSPEVQDLRIWSAACSTGQEPFSLAIILAQHHARLSRLNVRLFATDISSTAIERAEQGVFSKGDVAKLDPSVQRYFAPFGADEMRLRETVLNRVEFSTHNLMRPSPHQDLDCLFLRNVLIYFDQRSKKKVLANAVRSLRPGGYLVLGPSEGVFDIPDGLRRQQSFLFQRC